MESEQAKLHKELQDACRERNLKSEQYVLAAEHCDELRQRLEALSKAAHGEDLFISDTESEEFPLSPVSWDSNSPNLSPIPEASDSRIQEYVNKLPEPDATLSSEAESIESEEEDILPSLVVKAGPDAQEPKISLALGQEGISENCRSGGGGDAATIAKVARQTAAEEAAGSFSRNTCRGKSNGGAGPTTPGTGAITSATAAVITCQPSTQETEDGEAGKDDSASGYATTGSYTSGATSQSSGKDSGKGSQNNDDSFLLSLGNYRCPEGEPLHFTEETTTEESQASEDLPAFNHGVYAAFRPWPASTTSAAATGDAKTFCWPSIGSERRQQSTSTAAAAVADLQSLHGPPRQLGQLAERGAGRDPGEQHVFGGYVGRRLRRKPYSSAEAAKLGAATATQQLGMGREISNRAKSFLGSGEITQSLHQILIQETGQVDATGSYLWDLDEWEQGHSPGPTFQPLEATVLFDFATALRTASKREIKLFSACFNGEATSNPDTAAICRVEQFRDEPSFISLGRFCGAPYPAGELTRDFLTYMS